MAHFVKLIGSLQLDGSELVPLNFSFDYTAKLFYRSFCSTLQLRYAIGARVDACKFQRNDVFGLTPILILLRKAHRGFFASVYGAGFSADLYWDLSSLHKLLWYILHTCIRSDITQRIDIFRKWTDYYNMVV